jgi:hypothetical protein
MPANTSCTDEYLDTQIVDTPTLPSTRMTETTTSIESKSIIPVRSKRNKRVEQETPMFTEVITLENPRIAKKRVQAKSRSKRISSHNTTQDQFSTPTPDDIEDIQ